MKTPKPKTGGPGAVRPGYAPWEEGGVLVPYTVLRTELAHLSRSVSGMVPVGRPRPSSSPRREWGPQGTHQPQRGPAPPNRPATETQRASRPTAGLGEGAGALLAGQDSPAPALGT